MRLGPRLGSPAFTCPPSIRHDSAAWQRRLLQSRFLTGGLSILIFDLYL
jgi:hypothetical protein